MKIVKIGALWCPGCLVMKKVWKEFENKYPNIEIENLDLDFNSEECEKYNVGDVLPVIIFKDENDNEIKRLIGEKTLEDIENEVK